jgi:hypothetical protein
MLRETSLSCQKMIRPFPPREIWSDTCGNKGLTVKERQWAIEHQYQIRWYPCGWKPGPTVRSS